VNATLRSPGARSPVSSHEGSDGLARRAKLAAETEPEETMTELFYWKEIERCARAAEALAMLHNRTDTDGTPLSSLWRGCSATTTLSYISLLCAALA